METRIIHPDGAETRIEVDAPGIATAHASALITMSPEEIIEQARIAERLGYLPPGTVENELAKARANERQKR